MGNGTRLLLLPLAFLVVQNSPAFSFALCQSSISQELVVDDTLSLETVYSIAQYYARTILRSQYITAQFSEAKEVATPLGSSFLAEYVFLNSAGKKKYLVLEIAASTNRYPLLSYFIDDEPSEDSLRWDTMLVLPPGTPTPIMRVSDLPKGESIDPARFSRETNIARRSGSAETTKEIWAELKQRIDNNIAGDTTECRLNDVPIYLWYLNCALTTMTMEIGYWDDHGYPGFVPGGSSSDGYYWGVTEELCYINESHDFSTGGLIYFAQAAEYGNSSSFGQRNFTGWQDYISYVKGYRLPVSVGWHGPPYGAHATLGVGYQIVDSVHFLILHDTWRPYARYVNYDQYKNSISGFCATSPQISGSGYPQSSEYSNPHSIESLDLTPVNIEFVPALQSAAMAYHCFEKVDINGDGSDDYVVCSFRNEYSNRLVVYLYENGRYVKDETFSPILASYECLNVAKACDWDGDGDSDLAVTGYWAPLRLYVNDGNSINNSPTIVDNEGRGFIDLDWGDFNNDGRSDLVASVVNGEVRIYQNNGDSFLKIKTLRLPSQSFKVRFTDMNKDGWVDVIVSQRRGTVSVFYNHEGYVSDTPEFNPSIGKGSLTFATGDTDKDGYDEIVAIDNGRLLWYDNSEGGLDTNRQYISDGLECYAKDMSLTNLDTDNYPELIVANFNRPNYILHNNKGVFSRMPIWQSHIVQPTLRIQIQRDNNQEKKRIVFCRSRGCSTEFFEIDTADVQMPITQTYSVTAAWNIVSVPLQVYDYRKTTLYPTAISTAFGFHDGYTSEDTLKSGQGYWLNFPLAQNVLLTGFALNADTIPVARGWNIVGSISDAIPTSQVTSNPPGLGVSPFYRYSSEYVIADSIKPHTGYWVKVQQDGELILSASGGSSGAVQIRETGEMPPDPPFLTGAENGEIPRAFALDQNYPNPFNPSTTIKYELPKSSIVRLSVYDILGREVSVLVNERRNAGSYEVKFDALGLSSGVYFYRLQTGDFVQSRRLLLLR